MQVEWEKCALLELDITATDLSTECLIDMLTRIPALRYTISTRGESTIIHVESNMFTQLPVCRTK